MNRDTAKKSHKVVVKIFWSLIIIAIIGYSIYDDKFDLTESLMAVAILVFIWYFDIANLKGSIVDIKQGKIELGHMRDETQKAAEQVLVTANQFDRVVKSFTSYSLDTLQVQDRLSMPIPWRNAANFVNQAATFAKESKITDVKYYQQLYDARKKVIMLFEGYACEAFPDISKDISRHIKVENYLENGELKYPPNPPLVAIEELERLREKLKPEDQDRWRATMKEFKEFYQKNFEDA